MKKVVLNYLVIAALVVSAAFQFGCSKKAETSNETVYAYQFGYNVPVAIVPKEELPEFLRDWIDYLWESYVEKPLTGTSVEIFRGEWKNRSVYYLSHSLSSYAVDVRYHDGTQIDWSNGDNFEGFYSKNSNWVLIYQIKSGIVTQ